MTDDFANLVTPTFRYVIQLLRRIDQGECPELDPERIKVVALIEEAGRQAKNSSQLAQDFALARHALVYWVDEVLCNAPWANASEWSQRILEWQYFRERQRSERFYEEAEKAAKMKHDDPIELFYLCVAMGFRGKYDDDSDALVRWVQPIYERVETACRQPDKYLADQHVDLIPLSPLPGLSVLLGVSALVSVSALVTVAALILAVSP